MSPKQPYVAYFVFVKRVSAKEPSISAMSIYRSLLSDYFGLFEGKDELISNRRICNTSVLHAIIMMISGITATIQLF